MSTSAQDFNAHIIDECRSNGGTVGGRVIPVMVLTPTG